MTQTVHPPRPKNSGPRPEPEPTAGAQEPNVSLGEALEWLWRFFISRRTGLVLILLIGVLSLVGTVLEQAPADVRSDPQSYASWVDSVRSTYGGWTGVLRTLGLFTVFSSWAFLGIIALLTTSILACSIHRTPVLWRRATRPRTRMHDTFFDRAALHVDVDSPSAPDGALTAVRDVLRRKHFRTVEAAVEDGWAVYADQYRWAPFGSIAAHLGLVVVLVGAVVSANTGFKDTQFAAPVGTRVEVGHGTGLTVEALSFSDTYYDNGSPKDYASTIVLYRGATQVARRTIRVNQPLSYGGVSFYQSFFGTAAGIKVTDPTGKVVSDTAVPLSWRTQDGKHTLGQLTVPGTDLKVYVVAPASGEVDPSIQAGQVQLEVYRNGSEAAVATQVISQGTPAQIAGLTFTFVRERQFTGLIVARDPGQWLVWIGALLLIGGIFAVFGFPHRRIWLQIRPGERGSTIRCASHLRHDAAFEPRFRALAADIELAATPSSSDGK
jgi:cytochrome c biogenesis protein